MKALETAIINKLRGDSTLVGLLPGGIYNAVSPNTAAGTYMTFRKVSMVPEYTMSGRASRTYTYQFVIVGVNVGKDDPGAALDRVDALLTDKALTITGHTWWTTQLVGDAADAVTLDAGTFPRVGANYQIVIGD